MAGDDKRAYAVRLHDHSEAWESPVSAHNHDADYEALGAIATHAADVDSHHAKYTDAEAVDAVEAAGLPALAADIIPGTDDTYDLGSDSKRFVGVHRTPPDVQVYTTGTAATHTVDADYHAIIIEVIGGGGGGGDVASTSSSESTSSGGGGGGGYAKKVITRDSGLTGDLTYTVGAAGAASGTGGDSTVAGTGISTVTGSGGAGGGDDLTASTGNTIASGGAGGAATNGDLNLPGERGGPGVTNSLVGVSAAAPIATNCGGDSHLGRGGQPTAYDANGNAGVNYGGGGSGCNNLQNDSARTGGPGAAGVVIITTIF